jgi:mono/diheme cytochrome c family protein
MEKPWYSIFYVRSPILKILIGILSVLLAVVVLLAAGVMEENRMAAQTGNWNGRSIEKGAEIYTSNCSTCHGTEGQGNPGPALNSKYFFLQRLADVSYAGTLEDYIQLTVAAGRPSRANAQWGVVMPTWSSEYGGPLRPDQVQQVTNYILNWESTAVQQGPGEDPWIPYQDAPSKLSAEELAALGQQPPAPPSTGPRTPQEIFTQLACAGCHVLTLPQDEANRGAVGPNMGNLTENAANRVPGEDARTYIVNSITNPNAFIVPGYQPNIMPQGLHDRMTDEEFEALVNWLLDPNRAQ